MCVLYCYCHICMDISLSKHRSLLKNILSCFVLEGCTFSSRLNLPVVAWQEVIVKSLCVRAGTWPARQAGQLGDNHRHPPHFGESISDCITVTATLFLQLSFGNAFVCWEVAWSISQCTFFSTDFFLLHLIFSDGDFFQIHILVCTQFKKNIENTFPVVALPVIVW